MSSITATVARVREQALDKMWNYVYENFDKFSEANKIKVSVAFCTKSMPQVIEGNYNVTKLDKVKLDGKPQELHIGNRIGQFASCSQQAATADN